MTYSKILGVKIDIVHRDPCLVIYSKFRYIDYEPEELYFTFLKEKDDKVIFDEDKMPELINIEKNIRKNVIDYETAMCEPRSQIKLLTESYKLKILKLDNFTFQYCHRTINEIDLEIYHIKPVSKGGKTVPSNLQTLCVECNRKKSNK